MRDKWAAAVLASDLNNATKVVMWALYGHMDEHGRVRHRRDDLADECGLANARRVSDRIKEARDRGFLTARAGGVNGQVVQYYAELPGSQRQGPSTGGRGGGLQGPSNRDPQTAQEAVQGPRDRDPYAHALLDKPHGTTPAPVGSRAVGEADPTSTDGSYGVEWLPTPSKGPSSDSTGRVA